MRPAAPFSVPAHIGLNSTDMEVGTYLDKMVQGALLPENVITEVNPHNVVPRDLPGDIWYFFNSEDPKYTGTGYWKAAGENRRIFVSSRISVWRTTLEFYEGQAPHGNRTNWRMLEYRVNQEKFNEEREQVSKSLCRVFLNGGRSLNHGEQVNRAAADVEGTLIHSRLPMIRVEANSCNARDLIRMVQGTNRGDENRSLTLSSAHLVAQRPNHPNEDLNEIFSEGDYLELLDLSNPQSPSSSGNSSCMTISSDECFDASALLQDIEAGNDQNIQLNHTASRFSSSVPLVPKRVIMPAPLGSFLHSNGSKLPTKETLKSDLSLSIMIAQKQNSNSKAAKHAQKQNSNSKAAKHAPGTRTGSNVKGSASSSSKTASNNLRAAPNRESKTVSGRLANLKKKYCCFVPF